ncbi:MAG: hypothetical protein ACI8UO_002324 [Verrucomicrobiales bacterium]|jgi:uncharacterized protein (TIGR02596 family)
MTSSFHRKRNGFSLVEMMLVISVIALMITMLSIGFTSSFVGAELSGTARRMAAELEHGAQMAAVQNRPITVRFTSDLREPDEYLQGFQFGVTDSVTGEFKANSEFFRFPDGITIHLSERTTTLLRLADSPTTFEFHFYADGSTSLRKDLHWCVTLVRFGHATNSELPSSYRTVVINPYNGSTTLY